LASFDFDPSIRVVYAPGGLAGVGERFHDFTCSSVLIVTDPGVGAAGFADRARDSIVSAGIAAKIFSEVRENPTAVDIAAGIAVAEAGDPVDAILAVGGGSAMDCAKGINFLLTNGGQIEDYWGFGKASKPMLPSIGIPTTAGTGSEAQSYALISQAETHIKMACGDRKARFKTVILDPELIGSAPDSVKAAAGYDAIAHAVESFVCTKANPVSRKFAREGFRLLDASLEAFVHGRPDAEPGDVLVGAHLAGTSIEMSMLGAAHACANPLTAALGTTHGIAVGLMLPVVVAFNIEETSELYEELYGCDDLPRRLSELRSALGLPERLQDIGVKESDIPELAEAASKQWTATFNPRPINTDVCRFLYESSY
jgi:alcohol dehydrogenase